MRVNIHAGVTKTPLFWVAPKRIAVFFFVFAVAGVSVASTDVTRTEAAPRPNIIFVMSDDQDVDILRAMPFMREEMMPNATTFQNATFNYPLCCPSRVSMVRGQYSHNHKVWKNDVPGQSGGGYEEYLRLGYDRANLPRWLNSVGYQTGLFGTYVTGWDPSLHGTPVGFDFSRFRYQDWEGNYVPGSWQRDDATKDNAVNWISENLDGGPMFAWVSFYAPHTPFYFDPRYKDTFTNTALPKSASFNESDVSDKPEYVQNRPLLTEEEIAREEEIHRNRLRGVLTIDQALKEITAVLRRAGELNNTYVVYWTDNGYMMGEHRLSAKRVPYLESISFPMVVRGPGVAAGLTNKRIVMNQDVAPTFAHLGHAPIPPFVDGRSMAPILDGEGSWRDVGLIEGPGPEGPRDVLSPPEYRGIRDEAYTYVEYATGEKEYYDLKADPRQLRNAYDALPAARKLQLRNRVAALDGCSRDACRRAEGGQG